MKYCELVYKIITNSLLDGEKLQKFRFANVGNCMQCRVTASIRHMFVECANIKKVWAIIDKFGKTAIQLTTEV